MRSCHVEGNVGPGVSYRFYRQVDRAAVGWNYCEFGRARVGSFCRACDRAFSVVRCVIKGNDAREDEKVQHRNELLPAELRDSVVVFNAAVRGDKDCEVMLTDVDSYDESDEFDDPYYDEFDEFDDDDDLDDESDDDDDESDDDW